MIRLALVEDDRRLLDTLVSIFSTQPDFAVVSFSCAEDALRKADWAKIDVLLTDLDLPGGFRHPVDCCGREPESCRDPPRPHRA